LGCVTHKENLHGVVSDGKENPIGIASLAINQLPDFFRKEIIFKGKRATGGHLL
jgi:hypothetical protein